MKILRFDYKVINIFLIALVFFSVGINVYFFYTKSKLESKLEWFDKRIMVLANVTSAIARSKSISLQDVFDSGMISYPPYERGDEFLIDFDEHHRAGIKYIFNKEEMIVRWEEYPPAYSRTKKIGHPKTKGPDSE